MPILSNSKRAQTILGVRFAEDIECRDPIERSDAKLPWSQKSRTEQFASDFPTFLLSLASAIRTGLDPTVAFRKSADLFDGKSVIGAEIRKFSAALDIGETEEQALAHFGSSLKLAEVELFRLAFLLSRREGSSLSGALQRLAKVSRHRQSFKRRVRAALAMQKLSAYAIAGCTIIIGMIQFNANPESIQLALDHPIGSKILFFGAGLILAGLVWMRQIAAERMY